MIGRLLLVGSIGLALVGQVAGAGKKPLPASPTKPAPVVQTPPSPPSTSPAPPATPTSPPEALSDKEWRDAVMAGLKRAETWKTFTSPENDFTVRLPVPPKREAIAGPGCESITYTSTQDKHDFFVASQRYADDWTKGRDVEQSIDSGCNGVVEGLKGKSVGKQRIQLENKYPGRELKFTTGPDGKTVYRFRIYWVNPVMYMTGVKGDKEFVESTDAAVFLNSFRAVKKP